MTAEEKVRAIQELLDKHSTWDGGIPYCDTVKLLALPYAEHPDYDESWRP